MGKGYSKAKVNISQNKSHALKKNFEMHAAMTTQDLF